MLIAALVAGISTTPVTSDVLSLPLEAPSHLAILQQAVSEQIVPTPPKPTVESLISSVAKEYGISSTTLYNLAYSESKLNPDPKGHNDGGKACGVVQIHADLWDFDCQELIDDPEIGLEFAAKHIKAGTAWKYWTPANCYSYLKYALKIPLPRMAQITPNASAKVGMVAVFYYKSVKHVAYVTAMGKTSFTVKEANYKAGLVATREVSLNDPHLSGFYNPHG